MIGYVTLGTADPARAQAFYEPLLATIGATRLMEQDGFVLWGRSMDEPCLASTPPHDGGAASFGNGTMIALRFDGTAEVDAFHAKALELGGSDEGAPGSRGEGFYAAYFRDPDGNKLCAFTIPTG
jgi:catechol 2,3-dioxygenase-like lactoylglutathione lyase family enzyme